jgi:hypothetical protein
MGLGFAGCIQWARRRASANLRPFPKRTGQSLRPDPVSRGLSGAFPVQWDTSNVSVKSAMVSRGLTWQAPLTPVTRVQFPLGSQDNAAVPTLGRGTAGDGLGESVDRALRLRSARLAEWTNRPAAPA